MTVLCVVSIKDRAVDAFMRPVFVPATGAAVRSFGDEVNRSGADNEMNRHPDDYDLYHLGHFDDQVGRFALFDDPLLLVRAKDLVK